MRVLALLLAAALTLFTVVRPPGSSGLRNAVFDGYQRLFPLERTTAPAIVVAIDEEALAAYGQWPWPRTRLGELIERIAGMHPASIGLDLFFPEPDRLSPQTIAAELPLMPRGPRARARPFRPTTSAWPTRSATGTWCWASWAAATPTRASQRLRTPRPS